MRAGAASRAVALAVAAALPLLLWPRLGAPLDGSFDSSWRWGVNVAAERGLPAGLLPSGPLGHWIEPRAVGGGTVAAAARFQSIVRAAWLVALIGLAIARPWAGRWLAAALLWLVGAWIAGRWPEHDLVLLVLALAVPWAAGPEDGPAGRGRLVVAAALAGVAPWLKPSGGAAALAALAGASAARLAAAGRGSLRSVALAVGTTAFSAALAAAVAFDSFAALRRWLAAVPALFAGYGSAMALDLGPAAHLAALAPIAACAGAAGYAALRRTRLRALWVAAALPLAAALKHAIVRTDVHALAAAALGAGVLALALLLAEGRREAGLAGALAVVALAASAPHAHRVHGLEPGRLLALVGGVEGVRNAVQTVAPAARERALARSGRLRLRPYRSAALGAAGAGGVDVVPWRLSLLAANDLDGDWSPSPTFQLYQASTPELEARVAGHFAAASAPGHLLVHFDPLDERQPLWEAPRVWRTIAERYAVAARDGDVLVIERAARPRAWRTREIGEASWSWGRWHDLPAVAAGETLIAELELRPTPLGRLRRALVRAEPVWLDLGGRGPIRRWRLVPELAGLGLAVGETPRDLGELAAWLAGDPVRSGTRCRLRSPDADRYRPVTVRWRALRLTEPAS